MNLYSKKFKTNTLLNFGAVTIAVYAGMGMLAKPVEAMPIYQDQTGQKCSTCHSRSGILDRSYMPLTGHGKYFKVNGQLPPPPIPKVNKKTAVLPGASVLQAPAPVQPVGVTQGVTGKNVGAAYHGRARFEETGKGTRMWKEYGSNGVANFTFVETRRDACTVYLHDSSRRMDLEIDVCRKMIRNSDGRGGMKNLYKTTRLLRSR